MENLSLEFFSNDKYKILQIIYDNGVLIENTHVTPLSQQNISDIAHMSKPKVNKILNELKDLGYIVFVTGKGKYGITNKAEKVINTFRKGE